ncbi:MAG: FAD:protein FMN transferase, partial [Acidobacteria bacterium]
MCFFGERPLPRGASAARRDGAVSAARGVAILVLLFFFATVPRAESEETASIDRSRYLMGAPLRIQAEGKPASALDPAVEAAFARVESLDRTLSNWNDAGELRRLNEILSRSTPGAGIPVGRPLGRALRRGLAWARRTGGLFDPALGALLDAWGVARPPRAGTALPLAAARAAAGHRLVRLERTPTGAFRLIARRPGVQLDLDGIGKGIALDAAGRVLRRHGVRRALLDFGGQLLAVGEPPPGGWCVAVAHPLARDIPALVVRLRDGSLATSGNGERGAIRAGRFAGHVLDPRNGRPTRGRASFSVLARTAAAADALATAVAAGG